MKAPPSPVYRKWTAIRQAVYNPNCKEYPRVGGQGIKIYWQNFREFDEYIKNSIGYPSGHKQQLTRIDMTKDYEPGNLCWMTREQIAARFPDTIHLEALGERLTIREWSRRTGLTINCLYERHDRGCTDRQVLGLDPLPIVHIIEQRRQIREAKQNAKTKKISQSV